MIARELISEVILPLQPSDIGSKGLHSMEVFRISHLPVVHQGDFLGLISDADIFDRNMMDMPVGEHSFKPFSPFVYEFQSLYEVIELVSRFNLTAVPVLSEDHKYLGIITMQQLIQSIGNMASMKQPGGIIVLEMNINDYSLAQIARIVEDNDAQILSSYITSPADSMNKEITLKINRTDLTSIIQTFLRFDYTVKASFKSSDRSEDLLRNNYDQFMMYLNV